MSHDARVSRRDFGRLFTLGATLPLVAPELRWSAARTPPPTPARPDEKFWLTVRQQFVMPSDFVMLNAANLCPSSARVLETLYKTTRDMDRDP